MENGALEKKWEIFFFLVILFLVSFILIRAGLQRIKETAPLSDHQTPLTRLVENKTFLRSDSLPLQGDNEDTLTQEELINTEVIRQFNERSYIVSERIAKSVVGSSDSSPEVLSSDLVVFPESTRLPRIKDKSVAQMLATERANNSNESPSDTPNKSNVTPTNQPTIAVAIPFARQWEERKSAQEHESVLTAAQTAQEPESYDILHSDDMTALVKPAKDPAEKTKTESLSQPSATASHKTDSVSKPNPFQNVSLEKEVAPAAKSESPKPVPSASTSTVAKKNQTAPVTPSASGTHAAKAHELSKIQTKPKKNTTFPVATKKETTKTNPGQSLPAPAEMVVAAPATVKESTAAPNVPNASNVPNVSTGATAPNTTTASAARPGDEVWLVTNPCSQATGPSSLTWSRLEGSQFVCSTYEAYRTNEATLQTVVFVHGNLTDMNSAVESGMYLKCRLDAIRNRLGINSALRLIIWKWNSEKTFAGIRKDSQYKAALADEDGRSLAEFLRNDHAAQTTLLGFSFGAKMIGSACNILANTEHKTYNAIFVSAATDYNDYASCGAYCSGASCLNYLLNLYNPEDKALRFYPLLYGRGGAPALGTMPFTTSMLTPCLQGKAFSLSSACCGNQHKFAAFMQCIPDQTLAEIVFSFHPEKK